jgi:hypothetical protein
MTRIQADKLLDLNGLEADLRSVWSGRDALIEEYRALRFQLNAVKTPAALKADVVRAPLCMLLCERIIGMLTTDDPRITVPPANDSEGAQEKSSRLERALVAILNQIAQQQGDDPLSRFVECLVADGHGAVRIMYAPMLWKGFPKRPRAGDDDEQEEADAGYNKVTEEWKRGKPVPIMLTWLDPLTVFPVWDEMGLSAVLEADTRNLNEILPASGRWKVDREKPDLAFLSRLDEEGQHEVTFQQLWTRDFLVYAVNGEIVRREKHGKGRPPYVYRMGIAPSTRKPELMGLSVMHPLRLLAPYIDTLLTQAASNVRRQSWLSWKLTRDTRTPMGQEGTAEANVEIREGEVTILDPGEDLVPLVSAGMGPDFYQLVKIAMDMVSTAGLSDVLYGQPTGDSGYAIAQLIAAARMKLKPIIAHAETGIQEVLACIADIIEYQIKQRVYVWSESGKSNAWLSIGPEDLAGYRQFKVKINPVLPTDTYAKSSQAINEVGAGIIDRNTARENIGYEQPDEIERRILVDRIKELPQVQQWLMSKALERAGLELGPSPDEVAAAVPMMPMAAQAAMGTPGMGGGSTGSMPGGVAPGALPGAMPGGPPPMLGGEAPQLQGMNPPGEMAPPMAAPGAPAPGGPLEEVLSVIIMALEQGATFEEVMQQLVAMGLSAEQGAQLIQMAMQMMQQQGGGGPVGPAPGGAPPMPAPGLGGGGGYSPPNAVMAGPGVQAAPPPPPPGVAERPRPAKVGPVTKPRGIAGGKAPGLKRPSVER